MSFYKTLISTSILEQNLNNSDWIIFDCRSSLLDHSVGLKAYQEGHIPSAIFADLEADLSSPITDSSGRHPLPDFNLLIQKLNNWGVIHTQTQVAVYDDAGGAYAVRLWWLLRTLGHQNVAVLDGGIPQWINEGKSLDQNIPSIQATAQNTFTAEPDQTAWLGTQQILNNLTSEEYIMLDARTAERYQGKSEPIDTVAGRIPESLNRAFHLNLDENGLFLPAEALKEQFQPLVTLAKNQSPKNIAHFCGSGVTACHNLLAMEIAGFSGSKLYAGSWSEWIRDSARPVAKN